MANRSRQTFLKRRKEKERVARQRAKELRRRERSIVKERAAPPTDGDRDIMGIVPGPQEPVWKMADVLTEDERSALEEEEEEEEARA
ncbi:MAG: hypothetical protein OXE58_09195 [Acidobacteria bacterium]|nr:hypothetical protein [Acidobacteriota bacterium]